jgi:hypothetical protein
MPLTLNSEVLGLAEVTVTLDPVAVSVPVRVAFCPTTTLPKLMLDGETPSCPTAVVEPDSPMVKLGFEAVDVRTKFAFVVPVD